MKRQRGRGRKPGGHHQPNRTLESTGPDLKVRGPAAHIYEKYLQLARDAQSSGDRVMAENYLQHAEHYFRLVRSMQPAQPPMQPDRFHGDGDYDSDEPGLEGEGPGQDMEGAADGAEQPDVDFAGQQGGEGDRDGFRRNRRGRRNRFRPGEGGEGGEDRGERRAREGGDDRGDRPERRPREGGEERGERSERRARDGGEERGERSERRAREGGEERGDRPERPRRERGGEEAADAGEGFSSGPRPAFLGSD